MITFNYSWPLSTEGIGALNPLAVENLHITLQAALHICGSTSVDLTNLRSCSNIVHIYWKKFICKQTHSIKMHAVQESTIYLIFEKDVSN